MYFRLGPPNSLPRDFRPGLFPPVYFPPMTPDMAQIPGSRIPQGLGISPQETMALALALKKRRETASAAPRLSLRERLAQRRAAKQVETPIKTNQVSTYKEKLSQSSPDVQQAIEQQRQAIEAGLTEEQRQHLEMAQQYREKMMTTPPPVDSPNVTTVSSEPSVISPPAREPVSTAPPPETKKSKLPWILAAAAAGGLMLFNFG